MVELRTLAYFVTACRSASLAHAADDLGIAVSTLCTAMKALERDLGLSLFRRINNSLYPTEAARTLMRGADPLLMAELFARRFVAAPAKAKLKRLTVEVGPSFTVGGISQALRRAIDTMGAERPDVFVDPVWTDDKDVPHLGGLAENWQDDDRGRVLVGFGRQSSSRHREAVTALLSDRWVFACRLPAGTQELPERGRSGGRPPHRTVIVAAADRASRSLFQPAPDQRRPLSQRPSGRPAADHRRLS